MPKQKRSLMGSIYRAYRAFFEPLHRIILPLNSSGPIKPRQSSRITIPGQNDGFWPERLAIGSNGTSNGATDWIINDIRIAGKSQFIQPGDIPGDMFAAHAVDTWVRFDAVRKADAVEIVVTYVGTNEMGCAFVGALVGMEYDPGLIDIVREAIAQGLTSAARNLNTHSR